MCVAEIQGDPETFLCLASDVVGMRRPAAGRSSRGPRCDKEAIRARVGDLIPDYLPAPT
jgi:hypothetical protein